MRQKPITNMYQRRLQMGLTQDEVARSIGVTQPRVSLWEARLADLPPRRRAQIGELLGIDPDTLLSDA